MSLFDDSHRGKITAATEPQQVAACISIALIEFIASNPLNDIEVDANKNPATLRRRASGNTLEVTCDGPNDFRVKESMGFQQVVGEPRRSF
jgi:hypothetical protein